MKRSETYKTVAILLVGIGALLYFGILGAYTSCGTGFLGTLGAWLGLCVSYNGILGELMMASGVILYLIGAYRLAK